MRMTKYNVIPAIISALHSCSVSSKHLNNVRECRMYKRFNSFQEHLLNEETEQKVCFCNKSEEFPLLIKGWQATLSYNKLSGDSPAIAELPLPLVCHQYLFIHPREEETILRRVSLFPLRKRCSGRERLQLKLNRSKVKALTIPPLK